MDCLWAHHCVNYRETLLNLLCLCYTLFVCSDDVSLIEKLQNILGRENRPINNLSQRTVAIFDHARLNQFV